MHLGGNRLWVPLAYNRSQEFVLVMNKFNYKQCCTLRVLGRGPFDY